MSENLKEIFQYALGALIVIAFFAVLLVMIFNLSEGTDNAVLNSMVGILGALTTGVANYFFGSSKGSADKNKMMGGK